MWLQGEVDCNVVKVVLLQAEVNCNVVSRWYFKLRFKKIRSLEGCKVQL